jgi:uracil-DNA glycosylase
MQARFRSYSSGRRIDRTACHKARCPWIDHPVNGLAYLVARRDGDKMSDGVALSALDWWCEAGVDVLVEETPRDWLVNAAAAIVAAAPEAVTATAVPAARLPSDLPGFRRYLLEDAAIPGPPASRLDAAGDPASGTMVLVDMPEPGDRAAGTLLSGEPGALFDRMLTAMSLSRADLYLVPFAPACPASGRIDEATCRQLGELARHHVALVAPRRLLLMGNAPAVALTGQPLTRARSESHSIEGVPTIVTFHPRLVADRPALRRDAWTDLQRFMELAA